MPQLRRDASTVEGAWRFVSVEPHFYDGLRVTDALIMEVIEMVLAVKVNKNLVSLTLREELPSASASSRRASSILFVWFCT